MVDWNRLGPSRFLKRSGIPTIQPKWYCALKAAVVFWRVPAGGVNGIEPSDRDPVRLEHGESEDAARALAPPRMR